VDAQPECNASSTSGAFDADESIFVESAAQSHATLEPAIVAAADERRLPTERRRERIFRRAIRELANFVRKARRWAIGSGLVSIRGIGLPECRNGDTPRRLQFSPIKRTSSHINERNANS